MTILLTLLHIIVSLFLIFIVLVQGGKGAQMGAAFGAGSSQTVFGSRGAATFLGKLTTAVAVLFMLTSLLLAIASVRGTSVIKKTIPAAERPTSSSQAPSERSQPGQEPFIPQTPPPAQ